MKITNILNLCTEIFRGLLDKQGLFLLLVPILFIGSCGTPQKESKRSRKFDYSDISVNSGLYYRMVNCIKAGTQDFYHYDPSSRRFTRDSIKRNIPSPYNVGVLPIFNKETSSPEVIMLSTGAEIGEVIEFLPLGVLNYIEGDKSDFTILGVPVENEKKTMEVTSFLEFITQYDEVKFFIQEWWLSSGDERKQFSGWGDEKEAIRKLDSFLEK